MRLKTKRKRVTRLRLSQCRNSSNIMDTELESSRVQEDGHWWNSNYTPGHSSKMMLEVELRYRPPVTKVDSLRKRVEKGWQRRIFILHASTYSNTVNIRWSWYPRSEKLIHSHRSSRIKESLSQSSSTLLPFRDNQTIIHTTDLETKPNW